MLLASPDPSFDALDVPTSPHGDPMLFLLRRCAIATTGLALIVVSGSGCINYSSYQDARIVERGQSQGTVAVSASTYIDHSVFRGGNTRWYVIEMDPRWGLGNQFDGGMRMSLLVTPDGGPGFVLLGGDIRAGIIRDHLALTIPVDVSLGAWALSTINAKPGFIVTLPVSAELDINGAVRRSFYLNSDLGLKGWWLYNAGLGIVIAPGWRIRPELGWAVADAYDGERTHYMQFGIGLTSQH